MAFRVEHAILFCLDLNAKFPAGERSLRDAAPRFDPFWLVARIQDEAARAAAFEREAEQLTPADASPGRGVSLLDAALILTEEDRGSSMELKNKWRKLRTPKLPVSIGSCPRHKQVKLFAPGRTF